MINKTDSCAVFCNASSNPAHMGNPSGTDEIAIENGCYSVMKLCASGPTAERVATIRNFPTGWCASTR